MKSTEELRELYESELKPALQSIEETRKGLLVKYIICIGGAITSFLLALYLAETYVFFFYFAVVAILGLGFYFFFVVF